jgi:putative ABC transport system permease protein
MRKNFYVIENALLNLGKNKGRNLLHGVVVFAVITATVVALSIYNTANSIISEYKTQVGSEMIQNNNVPLEGLRDISRTFLLIVLALGAAIMVLLSITAVRERKYEIGVLRAMGMKKSKVALGLWVEIIVVTCLCSIFAMVVGGLLAQPISDSLLAGRQAGPVNISLSPQTALQIFAVAILLASIAGIISVSGISKYEPIKILMERN